MFKLNYKCWLFYTKTIDFLYYIFTEFKYDVLTSLIYTFLFALIFIFVIKILKLIWFL